MIYALSMIRKIGKKHPLAWASKIASLESLGRSQEKSEELKKFKEANPEMLLEEIIEKVHFEDLGAKNKFKELVI